MDDAIVPQELIWPTAHPAGELIRVDGDHCLKLPVAILAGRRRNPRPDRDAKRVGARAQREHGQKARAGAQREMDRAQRHAQATRQKRRLDQARALVGEGQGHDAIGRETFGERAHRGCRLTDARDRDTLGEVAILDSGANGIENRHAEKRAREAVTGPTEMMNGNAALMQSSLGDQRCKHEGRDPEHRSPAGIERRVDVVRAGDGDSGRPPAGQPTANEVELVEPQVALQSAADGVGRAGHILAVDQRGDLVCLDTADVGTKACGEPAEYARGPFPSGRWQQRGDQDGRGQLQHQAEIARADPGPRPRCDAVWSFPRSVCRGQVPSRCHETTRICRKPRGRRHHRASRSLPPGRLARKRWEPQARSPVKSAPDSRVLAKPRPDPAADGGADA